MESSKVDTSYLSQQVNSIINQLHGLFDDIGVADNDRENRESELFAALSETLNNQLRLVATEKKDMVDEAQAIVTTIRQMEESLDDAKPRRDYHDQHDDLQITFPLSECIHRLREKHHRISKLHRERFAQVEKLVIALESYSSHLEPSFVRIALPPTGPDQSIPPDFDISASYVDKLDGEFTRVYEEYTRRKSTVKTVSEQIIQLWAELGTPQAQTDGAIVKYYRDAPEQLGLHEEDISRLCARKDKLADEKKNRERRLKDLRASVEALWEKLGVEEGEQKAFMNANRGCGVRQINEFQDELVRLNELKHENLHLFVEDARYRIQELWDSLYFSEDEMLEFTPAFSDVYSDALLEAHERELARLEALKEQRAPILELVDRHRSLVTEQKELQTSAKDASRLMGRGQKGEKRDPGKLLREEKMRKRIARELPKVAADLHNALDQWEDEYGRPFLVHGERYLETLEEESKPAPSTRSHTPSTRSRTPGNPPPSASRGQRSVGPSRADSTRRSAAPSRAMTKTPTGAPPKRERAGTLTRGSPSRIPARMPLGNLQHGTNSPDRRPESRAGHGSLRGAPVLRAPPPKMRELAPAAEFDAPMNPYAASARLGSIVRSVEPEDPYDDGTRDRFAQSQSQFSQSQYSQSQFSRHERQGSIKHLNSTSYPPAPPPPAARQVSGNSHSSHSSTLVSGSENWETYDDYSEPEVDVSDSYYAKVRASRIKAVDPEDGHQLYESYSKRPRGLPPAQPGVVEYEGGRIISGSEWTDEDGHY